MYTLITLNAIFAGIIFGLGYGLFKAERRFQKIQEATFKVYKNADEKPHKELLDEFLIDVWNAMYK